MGRGLLYYLNGTIRDAPQPIIPEPTTNGNSFQEFGIQSFINFTKSKLDSISIRV